MPLTHQSKQGRLLPREIHAEMPLTLGTPATWQKFFIANSKGGQKDQSGKQQSGSAGSKVRQSFRGVGTPLCFESCRFNRHECCEQSGLSAAVCECGCVRERSQKSMLGIFPNCSPLYLLRQGLSLNFELRTLDRLASSELTAGVPLSPFPSAEITGAHCCTGT